MHDGAERALVAAKSKIRPHGYNYPSNFVDVEVAESQVAGSAARLRSFKAMAAAAAAGAEEGEEAKDADGDASMS